jgi:uncharacterized NAD-dependent epimerase/dehydratase family protein
MTVHVRDPGSFVLELPQPYLLFLADSTIPGFAKTAFGLKDWAPERCVGEFALPEATVSVGLPRLTPKQAYEMGARGLVIGVASPGGKILDNWVPALVEALEAGLDIISGMHSRLEDTPILAAAVARTGRNFIEVRRPPAGIPLATGRKRTGLRLLTVGTDCALGKKYTALALARAFRARGVDADFRATGQTGIMIGGSGLPMDAVVSDFEAGAAEMLTPDAAPGHWDVIEGQGSLFHPAYAAVSLGLLHGSQPDVVVVCHEPGRSHIVGFPGFATPTLEETIELNLKLGGRTNPAIRCAGVSLNTSAFSPEDAAAILAETSQRLGLPAADPIRGGAEFDRLVESCLG